MKCFLLHLPLSWKKHVRYTHCVVSHYPVSLLLHELNLDFVWGAVCSPYCLSSRGGVYVIVANKTQVKGLEENLLFADPGSCFLHTPQLSPFCFFLPAMGMQSWGCSDCLWPQSYQHKHKGGKAERHKEFKFLKAFWSTTPALDPLA